jgi:hypothetical protein
MIILIIFLCVVLCAIGGIVFYYVYYRKPVEDHLADLLKHPPVLGKMIGVELDATTSQPPCTNVNGFTCALVASPSQQAIINYDQKIDYQNSLLLLDYETKIYYDYVVLNDTININIIKTKLTALVDYMKERKYTNQDGTKVTTPF